ncbi:hypothetical protein GIB67_040414 [Kingdonia uniflora]|uniref:Uncharacterized protein n=1 Tax=Kingdonia uniflora TaxID=39325 RepID=A0A7J7KXM5_9MAGN|nr:hypothetical protein GIB67_040414 [Kingdonia uniflora]
MEDDEADVEGGGDRILVGEDVGGGGRIGISGNGLGRCDYWFGGAGAWGVFCVVKLFLSNQGKLDVVVLKDTKGQMGHHIPNIGGKCSIVVPLLHKKSQKVLMAHAIPFCGNSIRRPKKWLEEDNEFWKNHSFFRMRCIAKGKLLKVIVDSGFTENLISKEIADKLSCKLSLHPKLFIIYWLEKGGTKMAMYRCKLMMNIVEKRLSYTSRKFMAVRTE